MTKDQDLRLKLTRETHAVISELASMDRLTLQAYVERLVVEHCARRLEVAKALLAAVDGVSSSPPIKREQAIYFIQKGADGPIKIGVAASVPSRLKSLQTGSSEELRLLLSLAQSPEINERLVHRKFKHLRLEGEWFRSEAELLEFITYSRPPTRPVR